MHRNFPFVTFEYLNFQFSAFFPSDKRVNVNLRNVTYTEAEFLNVNWGEKSKSLKSFPPFY
jgi:hypothetical protein